MDDAKTLQYKRNRVSAGLRKCSFAQHELFDRMYPNGPRDDQLDTAITQIDRTVEKNKHVSNA